MTLRHVRHAPRAFYAEDARPDRGEPEWEVDREAEAVRRAVAQRADSV